MLRGLVCTKYSKMEVITDLFYKLHASYPGYFRKFKSKGMNPANAKGLDGGISIDFMSFN